MSASCSSSDQASPAANDAGIDGADGNTTGPTAAELAYRSAAAPPPAGWTGPVFALSHQYPQTLPAGGDQMPWLKIPVKFDEAAPKWEGSEWVAYMQSILDYIREGQDPNLDDAKGLAIDVAGSTRWFHMPWMAYDDNSGREAIHGLTNERVTTNLDLDGDGDIEITGVNPLDGATGFYETWSVGMYNAYGGYTIGKAFVDGKPQITKGGDGKSVLNGLPFATGTVVMKLLFTNASETDVPHLKGSPAWQAHRHRHIDKANFSCVREVQTSHLLQMDIAVVDPRSPTNWVLGTFAYNGNAPGATAWDRLLPVGVQWGNDPQAFPAVADKTVPIKESVINGGIGTFQHLGCNKRLNGPADNPKSSCMSCHANAYTAPLDVKDEMGKTIPPIFGYATQCDTNDAINIASNRNVKWPALPPEYPNAISLDTSLQFLVAFMQYKSFTMTNAPLVCVEPK